MTDMVLLHTVQEVLRREHVWVVHGFQHEGLLVKMVNTDHLVSPGRRPQSSILRCLYFLNARVTYVGAQDKCSIVCDRFPQCVVYQQ